jgi:recombination associated protein RdgC
MASDELITQLRTLASAKAFLGREFLTWLWYTAETTTERLKVPGPAGEPGAKKAKDLELDLWVDDRLALASEAHRNVMKGGDASHSREAAAFLATGKTVRELKLGLNIKDVGEFTAVLNADDLNPRALKLPAPGKDDGAPKNADTLPLVHRLKLMAVFCAALDGLFAHFLAERCAPEWEEGGLAAMRGWIKKRQKAGESATLH